MRAVREAGVEAVIIGSDTHVIEGLGLRLEEAVKRLEAVGYSHICVYEGRRNRRVALADVWK